MQNDYYYYHPDFDYYKTLETYVDTKFANKYTNHFKYYIHLLFFSSYNEDTFCFDCKCQIKNATMIYNHLGNFNITHDKDRSERLGFNQKRFVQIFVEILSNEKIILNKTREVKHNQSFKHKNNSKRDTIKNSKCILTLDPNFFSEDNFKSLHIMKEMKDIHKKIFTKKNDNKKMKHETKFDDLVEDDHDEIIEVLQNQDSEFRKISNINYDSAYYDIQEKYSKKIKLDLKEAMVYFKNKYKNVENEISERFEILKKSKMDKNEKDKEITILRLNSDKIHTKMYAEKMKLKNFNKKDTHFKTIADSGRLYNTFSLFNKEYRQFLIFDKSDELYEGDVSCSQPRMVLLRDDIFTDIDDNYRDLIENGDFYDFLAKKMNCSRSVAKKESYKHIFFARKNYKNELRDIFKNEFPKIAKQLEKNRTEHQTINAFYLQNKEALLIQEVCDVLIAEKRKFLTIHDSIITNNKKDADRVQELMSKTFKTNIKIEKIR